MLNRLAACTLVAVTGCATVQNLDKGESQRIVHNSAVASRGAAVQAAAITDEESGEEQEKDPVREMLVRIGAGYVLPDPMCRESRLVDAALTAEYTCDMSEFDQVQRELEGCEGNFIVDPQIFDLIMEARGESHSALDWPHERISCDEAKRKAADAIRQERNAHGTGDVDCERAALLKFEVQRVVEECGPNSANILGKRVRDLVEKCYVLEEAQAEVEFDE